MGNTSPTLTALSFLIKTIANLYALVVAIRFVMQAVGASGYGPIAQFIIQATDPLLAPLRKFVPRFRGYDLATLLLLFAVLLLKGLILKVMLQSDSIANILFPLHMMGVGQVVIFTLLSMLNLFFNVFIFSIFILAILSWIAPDPRNPVYEILQAITSPILSRVRKYIPPMGGLDLSALAALLGLYALKIIVIGTLQNALF